MTNNQVAVAKEDLRALVAGVLELDVEEVADHTHFGNELGVDSLMLLDVAARIEKRFGVKIGETEINEVESFAEVHELVLSKQNA
ncbi:acyl carrier protein [Amycolatopsis anabasis]|uniref:acyl carrier protein n=1 Tax=Amycolatopsis anabasis TaxID=1840409 RepID=UPI00131E0D45|nr:acyl carrier protein [Amycolatopsis anabasis]